MCFANATRENRLELVGENLCNAFIIGIAASNGPIIFTRRGVGKYGAIYLFEKGVGLEEMLDVFNNIKSHHIPSLFEEECLITI